MLRRWLTRFPRAVLVLLLIPLLGAVIWQAIHFTPKYVIDLAFSADGRHLLISFMKRNNQNQPIEASGVVQTWEVESSQLVDSHRIGQGTILFTPNATNFIDFSRNGHIRLLHPGTNQPLKEWHLPEEFGRVTQVSSNGHLAIVTSSSAGVTPYTPYIRYVTCLNSEGARVLAKGKGNGALPSGDRSRLFVYHFDRQTRATTTDVYQIDRESLRKLDRMSFGHWPRVVDSPGNIVFRIGNPTFSLLDLRTKKDRILRLPPGEFGTSGEFFAGPEGNFHMVCGDGLLAIYDPTTSKLISKHRLRQLSSGLWQLTVSSDGRMLAGTTDNRQVCVWNLTSGELVARFPDNRIGPICFASCLVVCCAWCLLWVVLGVHMRQTRPWLDMLAVNGLLLVVLTIHVATRQWEAIHPTITAAYLALLVALTAAICVWWIHGKERWSLRLAGLLAGLAIIVAALLGTGHHRDGVIWGILLGAVSYVVALALLLAWYRWRGFTLTSGETASAGCAQPKGSRWQMPLTDLLLFTASIAVLLGVARFVVAFPLSAEGVAFITLFGVSLAVTTLVAIWAALAWRQLVVRLMLLCFVAAVSGALPGLLTTLLYSRNALGWWPEMVCGFAALAVLLSFSIFRLHGYHLFRHARHALSEDTNTSPTR